MAINRELKRVWGFIVSAEERSFVRLGWLAERRSITAAGKHNDAIRYANLLKCKACKLSTTVAAAPARAPPNPLAPRRLQVLTGLSRSEAQQGGINRRRVEKPAREDPRDIRSERTRYVICRVLATRDTQHSTNNSDRAGPRVFEIIEGSGCTRSDDFHGSIGRLLLDEHGDRSADNVAVEKRKHGWKGAIFSSSSLDNVSDKGARVFSFNPPLRGALRWRFKSDLVICLLFYGRRASSMMEEKGDCTRMKGMT